MLNVKNGKIILEAIKVLGKNPILNILRFFDIDKKCLVNGNVHLISVDKGTFYTNGKSVMLKTKINNQVTNFCFNGRPLPYCKIYNKELLIWAQDLYTSTMDNNPIMARKYKCVRWIMNNYLDVFYFFINAKEINTTSIKHPNTRQYVENSFLPKDKQITTPNTTTPNTNDKNKETTTNKNTASSINSLQNNKQILNIKARKNVMSIAHDTRRKWEAQYPNYKALPYKERLQIALSKVWKAIKDSEIKAKEAMIQKDKQQSTTNTTSANNTTTNNNNINNNTTNNNDNNTNDNNKVIDINSKKQTANLTANSTSANNTNTNNTTVNNKYSKRIQGKIYVVFHPGLITLEDHQGKIINQVDFRGKLYNKRTGQTYDQVGIDPMKRFYIRTQMERAGQNVIVVLDKEDEIFKNDVDKSKYSCIYE